MTADDMLTMRSLDRAANHLLLAWFGRHSPEARSNLRVRAAAILMRTAERLLEQADEELEIEAAGRMVQRERW